MNQSKIYVGNFSYSVTEEELNEFFSQYGAIQELNLIKDRETGRSRGFAFISYESQQSAQNALAANGNEFKGRNLTVNMAREERRGGAGGRDGGRRPNGGGGGGRARW
jgi:RNA recognition motif-containing protein